MKILEYMALGKPIVAPRQENIQDLLKEGEEALFFSPDDPATLSEALKQLVNDPGMARRMGLQAREAVTRKGFLWTTNAQRVSKLVEGSARPCGDPAHQPPAHE
jgi:glycosyltransferase involved in cell wall biosynthesis